MSRSRCEIPGQSHVGDILAAAKAWRDRCFMQDGSIFSDESLWTPKNIDQLQHRFTDDYLIGGKELSFFEKVEKQLEGTEPKVAQLAAETFWFLYLIVHGRLVKPETKRARIKELWELSGLPMPESDYLADSVLKGTANPGFRFLQNLWYELPPLLDVATEWKSLPDDRKASLTGNAHWNFSKWVDGHVEGNPQIRHAILFFIHPDYFEPCVSRTDKWKIIENLEDRLPENLRLKDGGASNTEIDKVIYRIRQDLEKEYGTPLDFYESPIIEMWKKTDESTKSKHPDSGPTPMETHTLNTILYGPPGTGKTYATTRRCVEICDGQVPESDEAIHARHAELTEAGRIEFITFHQSYGYEEFVEGLRPETGPAEPDSQASPGFRLVAKDGVLKRIAFRARQSADSVPYVLVIDEINRANVSKVLGEFVTLLEEDKRQGAGNEVSVTLPHSGERFTLPSNLHILGTMNTADRSIALLDTALRRRFDFEELMPDPESLRDAADATGVDLPEILRAINQRLEWFIDRDHQIGHAWLMNAKTREDVDRIMRRKIIPLIAEYFYDDWKKVRSVLGDTDDFVMRESLSPPPGFEGEMGEARHAWTINEEFPDDAYENLIRGGVTTEESTEE